MGRDYADRQPGKTYREHHESYGPSTGRKGLGEDDYWEDSEATDFKLFRIKASSWAGTERPPREFLDQRRFIPLRYVSILAGQGAIGKTLLALQLALACSTATLWLGGSVRAGPALVYSAEEPLRELHIRIDEICEAEQLQLDQLGKLEIINLSHAINASLITNHPKHGLIPTGYYRALDDAVKEVRPVVVIIDNRSMVVDADENSRVVASMFIRIMGLVADRYGCAVVVLAHPSLSGLAAGTGASGSTGWMNAARSFLYMRRPKEDSGGTGSYRGDDPGVPEMGDHGADDGVRELINNKANYTRMDTKVNVKWEFNRFVCTDPPLDQPREEIGKESRAIRVFKKFMEAYAKRNVRLSQDQANHKAFAPTVFFNDRTISREGVSKSELIKAMWTLWDQGWLEIERRRYGSHYNDCLVIAGNAT